MKRRLLKAAVILAPLLLLAMLLRGLGPWLLREDPLEKAEAIVVLSGTMYERQLEALDLYKAGYAPRVYLLREAEDWGEEELIDRGVPFMRLVDVQVDTLVKAGLPREAIGILEHADNTAEEASFIRRLITTAKLSKVIVVTSKQHTRRARLVLHRRLDDTGVKVIVRASRYDRSNLQYWWRNRSTLRFTLFETQRLFSYWIGIAD